MSNQLCLTSSRCILHKIVSSIVIRTKMEWRRQEFELGGARRACSLNSGRNHKNFDTNVTNWKTEMTRCTTATVSLWLERDVYYQSATAHWIYNNVSRNCQIGVHAQASGARAAAPRSWQRQCRSVQRCELFMYRLLVRNYID